MNVVMLRSICAGGPYFCGYFPNKCDFLGVTWGGVCVFLPGALCSKEVCLLVVFVGCWGFFSPRDKFAELGMWRRKKEKKKKRRGEIKKLVIEGEIHFGKKKKKDA